MTSTSCHRVFVENLLLVIQDVQVNGEHQKDAAPIHFIHHSNNMTLRRVSTADNLATAWHFRQQFLSFSMFAVCNTFCQKLGLAVLSCVYPS